MRNWIVTLLFSGMFLLGGIASAQESPALTPKSPIPLTNVDGRIDHFSVDVKGQRLFASANGHHTLEVIDLQAGRQVHKIPDLEEPQGSFVMKGGKVFENLAHGSKTSDATK